METNWLIVYPPFTHVSGFDYPTILHMMLYLSKLSLYKNLVKEMESKVKEGTKELFLKEKEMDL